MTGPSHVLSSTIGTSNGRGYLWRAWHLGRRGISLDADAASRERDRGNRVHGLLEQIHKTGNRPGVRSMDAYDRNHAEALYAWLDSEQPEILGVEVEIYNERLDIRGRIDYVRRCRELLEPPKLRWECGCGGNGVRIGDQKHGGLTSPHAHTQVGGAYRLLWEEDPDHPEPVCGCELLGLEVEGYPKPYFVMPAIGTPEDFEVALAWFRRLERMDGEIDFSEIPGDVYLAPDAEGRLHEVYEHERKSHPFPVHRYAKKTRS